MKLFEGLVLFFNFVDGKQAKSYYCDTSELILPVNAEKWDCSGATGNLVPAGNKCSLKCDAGYIETICKYFSKISDRLNISLDSRRFTQICKPNGWRKPDQVDVKCKKDGKLTRS